MNQSHSNGLLSTVCTDHQPPMPGYCRSSCRRRKERIRNKNKNPNIGSEMKMKAWEEVVESGSPGGQDLALERTRREIALIVE
ncbi:hypothetical protein SRHO_G00095520 [Serrasalmus rhombeus]